MSILYTPISLQPINLEVCKLLTFPKLCFFQLKFNGYLLMVLLLNELVMKKFTNVIKRSKAK